MKVNWFFFINLHFLWRELKICPNTGKSQLPKICQKLFRGTYQSTKKRIPFQKMCTKENQMADIIYA
jgi:hypothetical protein